jgi:hypothetical protein
MGHPGAVLARTRNSPVHPAGLSRRHRSRRRQYPRWRARRHRHSGQGPRGRQVGAQARPSPTPVVLPPGADTTEFTRWIGTVTDPAGKVHDCEHATGNGHMTADSAGTCDQAQGIRREVSEAHRQIQERERPTYSGLGGRIQSRTPSPASPSCSPCLAPRSTGRSNDKTAQRADPPTHIARSPAPGDTILTGSLPASSARLKTFHQELTASTPDRGRDFVGSPGVLCCFLGGCGGLGAWAADG